MNRTPRSPAPGAARPSVRLLLAIFLCWATMLWDGYDLLLFGTTLPAMVSDPAFGLRLGEAGAIASYALVGMLIGTTVVGTLTDLVGRRKVIIGCQTAFSALTVLSAFAPTPTELGLLRFLAGIALGGALPTVISLTLEYAAPHRKTLTYSLMYSGYSVGGIAAPLLALVLIPSFGWRACYGVAIVALIVLVPMSVVWLPESAAVLRSRGRHAEADAVSSRLGLSRPAPVERAAAVTAPPAGPARRTAALRDLFSADRRLTTALLWIATFAGLLLTYGLGTWIPQIMRSSGYELGPALLTAVALNVGALVGTIVGGLAGDRIGLRRVLLASFGCAIVACLVLSLGPSFAVIVVAIALAGAGSIGTALLMNAFVASHYPRTSQATAVGWALGFGRIGGILGPVIGGAIAAAALPVSVNFVVFGLVAAAGGLTVLLLRRTPTSGPDSPDPTGQRAHGEPAPQPTDRL